MIHTGDYRIQEEDISAIAALLRSGAISEGDKTAEFENHFSKYIGTKHCTAVSSGTSALLVGLSALLNDERYPKFKTGAKIITSPLAYAAVPNAIMLSNLKPVFVDVNLDDFSMNIEQIEKLLGNSDPDDFAAILPVHLMGYPNDMRPLKRIADKYGLIIFEDSSQSHGSLYEGKRCGSFGLISAFSFYVAHNIQAGEMGAVCTDDDTTFSLIKKLKANGRYCSCSNCTRRKGLCPYMHLEIEGYEDYDFDPRFTHQHIGYNFKITEIQALLAMASLKEADAIFKKRLKNVKTLNSILQTFQDIIHLPKYSEDVSYLGYPIVVKNNKIITRREFRMKLESAGVETRPLFGSIPAQQPAYRSFKEYYKDKLPIADFLGCNGFYIGCHQYLSKKDLESIGSAVDGILGKKGTASWTSKQLL